MALDHIIKEVQLNGDKTRCTAVPRETDGDEIEITVHKPHMPILEGTCFWCGCIGSLAEFIRPDGTTANYVRVGHHEFAAKE